MILSATYNFFNGEEHLIASLKSIRSQVDYINIVYQTISNHGNKCTEYAKDVIFEIKTLNLVDKLIYYEPNLSIFSGQNELIKRQIGLQDCIDSGATHFFTIDSDEFYRAKEIEYAKHKISNEKYTSSSTKSFLHVRRPIYRGIDNTNIAFITEIQNNISLGGSYPINNIDPTRTIRIPNRTHYHFTTDEVAMYHMCFVRKNFESKFKNTSSASMTNFINRAKQSIDNWSSNSELFIFPNKPPVKITRVKNEFDTFDPQFQ